MPDIRPRCVDSPTPPVVKWDTFPEILKQKIADLLERFEHAPGEIIDVVKHIMNSDVDLALEDSVPLFTFFKLNANKAKEREEYFGEQLKKLEQQVLTKGSKERLSVQRASVYESVTYRKCQAAARRFRKVRRDCEDLAEAMRLRKEIAQTRSADNRKEIGGYQSRL